MTQHDGGWSQDKDTELVTLEQLYEQLNTMHTAGVAQEHAQIHALQAIESERRIVEDALRDLDMEEDNGTQEYVVRPIDEASKYAVPHLSHEQIQAIPLLVILNVCKHLFRTSRCVKIRCTVRLKLRTGAGSRCKCLITRREIAALAGP